MPDPFEHRVPADHSYQVVTGKNLGVEIRRANDDQRIVEITVINPDGLRAADLARLPWATVITANDHLVRALADGEDFFGAEPGPNVRALRAKTNKLHEHVRQMEHRPGRAGHSDDFYRDVAGMYRAHLARGERYPVQAITNELAAKGEHVSRNTVASWVKRARQLGHLDAGRRGVAG